MSRTMKTVIVLLIILSSFTFAQEKYLVSFKDKGIPENTIFSKQSSYYYDAVNNLSQRGIERRKKSNSGDLVIEYEDVPVKSDYVQAIENTGAKVHHILKWFNAVSVYASELEISQIQKLPFVKSIEPVKKIINKNKTRIVNAEIPQAGKTNYSNNLDYGLSFTQLNLSDIPAIHKKDINGNNVIIGLLDSGYDWQRHLSLKDATVIAEYDFVFNDGVTKNEAADRADQHDHGTYVFSIIGGYKPGSVIGSAYKAKFVLAKTEYIPTETHTEEDNYARALEWMDSIGVDITSTSLGYSEFDAGQGSYSYSDMNGKTTIVTKAAELAFARGILTFTSAGNEGNSSWRYITAPADGFNTLAIGAVDQNLQLASFSSRGPTFDERTKPDIVTQGVNVYGARASSDDNYGFANGTSSASPIAAGIGALLLSKYAHLSNVQLRNIIIETASQSNSPDNNKGYGLSSALRALTFPNVEYPNNRLRGTIHKMFAQNNIVNNSVELYAKRESSNYSKVVLDAYSNNSYSFKFDSFKNGEVVSFYFVYKDSAGTEYREPSANKDYNFIFGSENISANSSFLPEKYSLEQNYPNPFNSGTNIRFYSPSVDRVELNIYNVIGEKIKTVFSGNSQIGKNEFYWSGKNEKGITASSGVYYYVLRVGEEFYAKKMVLLK